MAQLRRISEIQLTVPVRTSPLSNLYRLLFRLLDVRALFLFLTATSFLFAESHPSWWTYASPEATALVGIQWDRLRHSLFAEAIADELAPTGSLRFPDLACLRDARQIIVSSPALLAMVTGNFPAPILREQTTRAGMKPASYRGVTLWIAADPESLGVAVISDGLLLLGSRRTLESALDRTQPDAQKHYSPLLARAAHFAQTADLWVVATRLPDPLASLFVPIEADAKGFEGLLSVGDGLYINAVIDAGSEKGAAEVVGALRGSTSSLPAVLRGLQIETDKSNVTLTLKVSRDQLAAGLRGAPEPAVAPIPVPVTTPPVVAIAPVVFTVAPPVPPVPDPPKPEPRPAAPPEVIRITGLDDGPRVIVLPPVKKQ
jgi:hypothetical protein